MSGYQPEQRGQAQEAEQRNPPRPAVIVRVFRYFKRRDNRKRQARKKQTDHQRNERMMAVWTRRVGLFTIVIAVISALSAWIFYGQQIVMQGQLDEMKAEQRPWVSADIPEIGDLTISSAYQLHVLFKLSNSGHTPAQNVYLNAKMFPVAGGPSQEKEASDRQKRICLAIHVPVGAHLAGDGGRYGVPAFPASDTKIGVQFSFHASDMVRALKAANGRGVGIAVAGCVDYFDTAGGEHQTGFLYSLDIKGVQPPYGPDQVIQAQNLRLRLTGSQGENFAN